MTIETKKAVIDILTAVLQDNLGNKLTVALANGILQLLDNELQRAAEQKVEAPL